MRSNGHMVEHCPDSGGISAYLALDFGFCSTYVGASKGPSDSWEDRSLMVKIAHFCDWTGINAVDHS